MTTTSIKKKITKAVNSIDDNEFLNAIHTIINARIEEEMIYELSPMQKNELDARKKRHKSGMSKSYTWQQIKKELQSRK